MVYLAEQMTLIEDQEALYLVIWEKYILAGQIETKEAAMDACVRGVHQLVDADAVASV